MDHIDYIRQFDDEVTRLLIGFDRGAQRVVLNFMFNGVRTETSFTYAEWAELGGETPNGQ